MELSEEVREHYRRIGRLGGKARAAKLTPEQRSEQARKAGKLGGRPKKDAPK